MSSTAGKYSVGYFANWGIYSAKFPPSLIPVNDLTHVMYSFANLRPETGEVYLSDLWADQDLRYPGDPVKEPGTNLYGNLKAMYKLKKQNRTLKVLLSIGGWTYSPSFHPVVVNPALRSRFVTSALKILEDYGFDGLDIDYEFPQNDAQAKGYAALLKELRFALDRHSTSKTTMSPRPHFWLTAAVPCGADSYTKLRVSEMDKSLDFWNLMAYDFAGAWSRVVEHQANLRGGSISGAAAVNWYINQGVPRRKIVLGIPLYGRAFLQTQGLGKPFSGTGQGTWGGGIYDYRVLPLPGATVFNDLSVGASWTYDSRKREFVSFDSEEVAKLKAQYIKNESLGGGMFWELSGDKGTSSTRPGMETGIGKDPQPGKSLVKIVKDTMGNLEKSQNCLSYIGSKFDNLRKGMP